MKVRNYSAMQRQQPAGLLEVAKSMLLDAETFLIEERPADIREAETKLKKAEGTYALNRSVH